MHRYEFKQYLISNVEHVVLLELLVLWIVEVLKSRDFNLFSETKP